MSHKIYIFVPGYGQSITSTTFLLTHSLMQTLSAKGIGGGLSTLSFPDIAELRDMALTIWYDRIDASHLLFVDSDMGFPPELVLDMLMFDEPVVGSIYPQRQLPTSWAGSGTGEAMAQRRGDFMKVEGVGMGCCLIRKDAVTNMLAKMPGLVDTRLDLHPAAGIMRQAGANRLIRAFDKLDIPERGVVSEDLSFCIRHNQCGGEVWAAIGHRISHVGPYDYGHRYLDMTTLQIQTVPRIPLGQQHDANQLPQSAGGTAITQAAAVVETIPPAITTTSPFRLPGHESPFRLPGHEIERSTEADLQAAE